MKYTKVESKHVAFDEAQLNKSPEQKIMHLTCVDFLNDDNEFFTDSSNLLIIHNQPSDQQPSSSKTPTEEEKLKGQNKLES